MICDRCNCYNEDGSDICSNCGADLNEQRQRECGGREPVQRSYETALDSKVAVGVILNVFLGIIGLLIGLLIYPYKSYARSTFIKGWVGLLIFKVVAILVFLIIVALTAGVDYI